jgi:hypothetical protein
MAIRYTKSYNKEIRKAVKHFNTVRNTLSKRGIKLTPSPLKVSELKARYQTRRELNRELTLLNKVSSSSDKLLKEIENSGGATSIKWELDYLKLNERNAINYFEREAEIERRRLPEYPGERMRLDALEQKIQYLKMDIDYMNQEQFRSYRSAIREYMATPAKMKGGYRGFLSEIESVMRVVGYDEATINTFFEKFKVLTPSQFQALYETSDLISRIYELADSPIYSDSLKMNTTTGDAKEMIDTLLEETDEMVEKAKQMDRELMDFENRVAKTEIPKPIRDKKIPKSSLTNKQINDLTALGWDDLIDENK